MKVTAVCLLALLAAVVAHPPTAPQHRMSADQDGTAYQDDTADQEGTANQNGTKNNVVELFLLGMLEYVRSTMVTGSDTMRVLDPLQQNWFTLNLTDLLGDELDVPFSGDFNLTQLIINNLSTFVVNELSFNMFTQILQFDIHIPLLELLADNYKLYVNVDNITVNGDGKALLHLQNLRVTGSARALPSFIGGISLQVQSVDLTLHLDGWKSELENLLGPGDVSVFANSVLGELVPQLVFHFQDEISTVLNEVVMSAINRM